MMPSTIAIDGPAGSGKSTLGAALARRLKYSVLDIGIVYRLVTLVALERALDPEGPWCRLTMALAYATEAHLFVTDIHQSPFNVGTQLTLEDFTLEQVADLNERYGAPLQGEAELLRYAHLVGGQPYLVRRGLHDIVAHDISFPALERQADRDEGIFGDHLRRMLVLLARDPDLCEAVRGVLRANRARRRRASTACAPRGWCSATRRRRPGRAASFTQII